MATIEIIIGALMCCILLLIVLVCTLGLIEGIKEVQRLDKRSSK